MSFTMKKTFEKKETEKNMSFLNPIRPYNYIYKLQDVSVYTPNFESVADLYKEDTIVFDSKDSQWKIIAKNKEEK
jgi:hypothetical protein